MRPLLRTLVLSTTVAACVSTARSREALEHSREAVEVETWAWSEGPSMPGRGEAAMTYDALRDKVVLFGGWARNQPLDDTWLWDGASWQRMNVTPKPPARSSAAMVFDGTRTILIGGYGAVDFLRDAWTWDGSRWAPLPSADLPAPRWAHAAAYDTTSRNVVLFGGFNELSVAQSQTLLWNGTAWSTSPSGSLGTRTYHTMVADPSRSGVVLFGGEVPAGASNETWLWTAGAWSRIATTGAIAARSGHAMARDPQGTGRIMVFGGVNGSGTHLNDTWTLNSANVWTNDTANGTTAPGAVRGASMAYDANATRQRMLVFGGYLSEYGPSAATDRPLNETWSRAASGPWTPRRQWPLARGGTSMTWDPVRRNVMLFGGERFARVPTATNDTWTWDGAWTLLAPSTTPSARAGHATAFDKTRGVAVLFGGTPQIYNLGAAVPLADTWTWDGVTWTLRSPGAAPSARAFAGFAFDAKRNVGVLFGGQLASGAVSNETWIWNGTTWTQVAGLTTTPVGRRAPVFVYDTAREAIFMFGGEGASQTLLGDTWLWDGTSWVERSQSAGPTPRAFAAAAYDEKRARVILHGGTQAILAPPFRDTWAWDGAGWDVLRSTITPGNHLGHCMAFDGSALVAFGGYDAELVPFDSTWVLNGLGGACATNSDCPGAFCTDGVCCSAATCKTCQTCAGLSPGKCAPVVNREDPDSCAEHDGKSCSDLGECRLALGTVATNATDCASGFLTDGVCCAEAACDACETCDVAQKQNAEFPGRCSAARVGTDPHERCDDNGSTTCQQNGVCDGTGKCQLYADGTPCGEAGQVCTGGGRCALPAGGSCDGDHTVTSPDGMKRDCGAYKCEGSVCKTTCARVDDCVAPASCTFDGKCSAFESADGSEGGCNASATPSRAPSAAWLSALAFVVARRRSRQGRATS